MKKLSKVFLYIILAFVLFYIVSCVLSGIWLRRIIVGCNTAKETDSAFQKFFSDESLMNKLDYRSEARHLTANPTYDIQVSKLSFFIGPGYAKARFYVTWNGYENADGNLTHRMGVSKQPVDVVLQWQGNHWIIIDVTKHDFLK